MKTYVKKCIDLVSKLLTITTAHYVYITIKYRYHYHYKFQYVAGVITQRG